MKTWFSKNAIHFAFVGLFIAICFIYFPAAWKGQELFQHDVLQAKAGQKEILDFKQSAGELPLWTNSMFSGMPTYQVLIDLPSNIGTYIMRGFKAVFPHPIDVAILYLLGAYLLLVSMRLKPWVAAVGAIAFAFSSYNFIYLEAGHSSKAYAIAFLAPILAGIIQTFRGKYLIGGLLIALFVALEIRVNHVQVPYYMFLAMLVLAVFELYYAVKDKTLPQFGKALGVQAVTLLLALGVNASLLWPTYEYTQLSTRGKSNLPAENAEGKVNKGLDKEYAYQWSQGVGECLTFLIPNAYGGGAVSELGEDSHIAKLLKSKGASREQALAGAQSLPTYWGEKPFTSGPWYFGATVLFLFFLGAILLPGRTKWWLLSATLLLLLLSFGRHLPLVSDLFFHYFPLYNKFRAVESTLIVVSLLVPILAALGVNELIQRSSEAALNPQVKKSFLYVLLGLGGLTLLIVLVPDLFLPFKASSHQQLVEGMAQQIGDRQFAGELAAALVKDRVALARSDAFRSLIFILLTAGLVWLLLKRQIKPVTFAGLLAVLVLVDLWMVDKRYLNDERFSNPAQLTRQFNAERDVDRLIHLDKDLSFRVFDLTVSPFQDARASYHHKSIGGYHAAKLMRYQELIEHQMASAINEDVLDMLNTRYIIVNDKENQQRIQRRSSAAGNAWFVERVRLVEDNAAEMRALDSFDPKKEAFVHKEFAHLIDTNKVAPVGSTDIKLVSYKPDHLTYEYSIPTDAMAIFSEIWYPKGWKAFVDGKEVPIVRANYVLRGVQLPRGNNRIEFRFEPQSYHVGEKISLVSSIILLLGGLFILWKSIRPQKV